MYEWKSEYDDLTNEFAIKHFGPKGYSNITSFFPCMRDKYKWATYRPDIPDSRVAAKNNTEYHGLEEHAKQYHVTAQYEEAYHYWLMAADWRRQDMLAHNFDDDGHKSAVTFCIKQALYNKALTEWQTRDDLHERKAPAPEEFELTDELIRKMDEKAEKIIEEAMKNGKP
ncbi:MAG: hypothetical protein LC637_09685 [Xanthomonadaceae bacterium]|nr:hypothetical protein [Xanthomonadaceae bacterium]